MGSSSLGFDIGVGYFFDFYLFAGDSKDIVAARLGIWERDDVGGGLGGGLLVFWIINLDL